MKPGLFHLDRRAAELMRKLRGDPDDRFSISELADELGVSGGWLYAHAHRGTGPVVIERDDRFTQRFIFRRGDVLRWLQQRDEVWLKELQIRGRSRKTEAAA